MFFEPSPSADKSGPRDLPERPPWSGPPPEEAGAVLAVERTVARSANVAVRVPTIRAFRSGCMLDVEVVSRQGTLSEDDWWDLRSSAYGHFHRSQPGAALPAKLLRMGVRYADGTKATTIGQHRSWAQVRTIRRPGRCCAGLRAAAACTAASWASVTSGCGCGRCPRPSPSSSRSSGRSAAST
jgi:hypothetical protein